VGVAALGAVGLNALDFRVVLLASRQEGDANMTSLRTIAFLGTFLVPGLALASHGRDDTYRPPARVVAARLEIGNSFDGDVDVYLDGRYSGVVAGDGRLVMERRPGPVDVRVVRPGTGYVLLSTRVVLTCDANVFLPVRAPEGVVRVRNSGEVALRVDLDDQHVWLFPMTQVDLRVTTGRVDLQASIRDPRGEFLAMSRDLWVEPGRVETTVLAPDPSVLRLFNTENVAVRVLLDGIDAGILAPGASQQMYVRPGTTRVVLVDLRGNVRYSNVIDVAKGGTTVVDLRNHARGPVPVHVATVNVRRSVY
jgi:hypothetical protein